jgi:membrane protease YdiL (CAAX protease family)
LIGASAIALFFGVLRDRPGFMLLPIIATEKSLAMGLTTEFRFRLFAIYVSVIHSLLEEGYWRAFVFVELRREMRFAPAMFVSSIGFMAHHVFVLAAYFPYRFWEITVPLSIAVAVGGGIWATLYERYENIVPSWFSHALVDAAIMYVGHQLLWS